MGWSINLGKIGGIVVRVHLTFFLLIAWIGTILWIDKGPAAAVDGVAFVLLLFGCVVLHELGHAFAASRYGIGTRDITLLPIGGLAALDRMPDDPKQEIVVALAGPAVNVVIAALLFVVLGAQVELMGMDSFGEDGPSFLARLAMVNLFLAAFNLLPAFPMDGGRVLRAVLGLSMSRGKATQIAARIGQALAVLFAFLGLLGNPILILIAIFVFFAASAEAYSANMRDFARGRSAQDAMITRYESLTPQSSLDEAGKLLLATTQQEFPVVDLNGHLLGFVTRQSLVESLQQGQGSASVKTALIGNVPTKTLQTPLENIVGALESRSAPAVGITDSSGRLVGYITLENLAEFFMLRSAGGLERPSTSSRMPDTGRKPTQDSAAP